MPTLDGWKQIALKAVHDHDAGDDEMLDLLAQLLSEQDAAKQALRDKGYGCIGMPWAETVAEVLDGRP
jgi:hypothetical protein